MALIQMASVDEAVSAVIVSLVLVNVMYVFVVCTYLLCHNFLQAMHNYKISETNHLRVSFSKNPIST